MNINMIFTGLTLALLMNNSLNAEDHYQKPGSFRIVRRKQPVQP